MAKLSGKRVAILTENGFEEVELTSPKKALAEAGAEVHIVSPQKDKVKAWDYDHWSIELSVDVNLHDAKPDDYDALVIPGGVEKGLHLSAEIAELVNLEIGVNISVFK